MAKSTSGVNDLRALNDLISSTLTLLGQFTTALKPTGSPTNANTTERIENPPSPLRVLSDSAKLVKAHTTKLSLLAINKPFTPSAIHKVLKELSGTCLPAMMSAVQICEQEKAIWSGVLSKEVQARVRRVFKEMEMLLGEVRSIAAGNDGVGRDSLSSTGIVWESCDALIELEQLRLPGLVSQKAEQYRETIKDAIQELQEWTEGDDLDSEGRIDGLLDSDDEGVDGDKDSIEDIFNAANSMPKDRPDLKALVEEADGKLKKIVLLYQALGKRRIRIFNHPLDANEENEGNISRLDVLMVHLRKIPHQVDEFASNLYDLDEPTARATLKRSVDEAKAACKEMELDWSRQEDAFTEWLKKWNAAIG